MISLIMATYNGEKYILEQLDSIRNQTLAPDEVIICDDCSTDNTYRLLCNYIKKYSLESWQVSINPENKGYSRNFRDLINQANGDIIFLADQDDIWNLDKIKNMTDVMEKHPEITLLTSNVMPFYVGENPKKVNYEKFNGKKELVHIRQTGRWIKPARPGCSMCFRPRYIKEFNENWFSDYPHDCLLWGLSVLHGDAYVYNRETMKFRRHDNNASSRIAGNKNKRIEGIDNELKIMNQVIERCEDIQISAFIKKQIDVYQKRKHALQQKNIVSVISLIVDLKYFGRPRFWLTDIYYCLK